MSSYPKTTQTHLLDARGVEITPGDTAIYGFGVGRSIAMAEAVVLMGTTHVDNSKATECPGCVTQVHSKVSLTASGRVRLRVVRRSYSDGVKPVVDVAPDRLVVLKLDYDNWSEQACYRLPPSPLPTQDEEARLSIELDMARSTEALRATEAPEWWKRPEGHKVGPTAEALALAEYHAFHAAKLKEDRRKLKDLDD